jgi:hypothetical protein
MWALENSVIHVGRAAHSMWMTDFPDLSTWMTDFPSPACCAPRLAFVTVYTSTCSLSEAIDRHFNVK